MILVSAPSGSFITEFFVWQCFFFLLSLWVDPVYLSSWCAWNRLIRREQKIKGKTRKFFIRSVYKKISGFSKKFFMRSVYKKNFTALDFMGTDDMLMESMARGQVYGRHTERMEKKECCLAENVSCRKSKAYSQIPTMKFSGVNPALENSPAYSVEPAKAPLGGFGGDSHHILAALMSSLLHCFLRPGRVLITWAIEWI